MPLPAEPGGDPPVGQRRRAGHVDRDGTLIDAALRYARPRIVPALLALAFVFTLPFLAPEGLRGALLGPQADDPVAIARVEADEHLDLAAPVRYAVFVGRVAHGDFGRSYVQPLDVEREVARHALLTLALVAAVVLLTRNVFGPAVVFAVMAGEAVLDLPGLGRLLADAVDVRDLVMVRAVLAVALLGCVAMPRRRERLPRVFGARAQVAAWLWLFVLALVVAFAQRLPLPGVDELFARRDGPSLAHWLGTDDLGHDITARLVWGAQGSLALAFAAAVVGTLLGVLAGALAAESPRARRGFARVRRAGLPAIGIAVGLAAVLPRDAAEYWQWLVPVTVGPAFAWASRALAPAAPSAAVDAAAWRGGAAAAVDAFANALVAQVLLGALGCGPTGAVTWGTVVHEARVAEHDTWWELAALAVLLVGTVLALRGAAAAIRGSSRRLGAAPSGTMAPVPTVRSAPAS